ncbi:MAG: Ppx/GppA family phosphatase [Nitrospinales bacterium]
MKKIASIDIGANTARMTILALEPTLREVASGRAITRLGEGIDSNKRLLNHRIEKTLDALRGFLDTCRQHGEMPIYAVATSAVREAANREEFLQRVKEKTNLDIQVIPWEEEARLTLEGVLWKISGEGKTVLTFDIGGGSTEYILSRGKHILKAAGTSLGVVRLTEKFISRHPVDPTEYQALENHLRAELAGVRSRLPDEAVDLMIGTAGTVTTLAALDKNIYPYDPLKVHGATLQKENIHKILDDLKNRSLEERLQLKPLERGREDLIIAGTALVLQTMDTFACKELTVSEYGLREGIILKHLAAQKNTETGLSHFFIEK